MLSEVGEDDEDFDFFPCEGNLDLGRLSTICREKSRADSLISSHEVRTIPLLLLLL